jgi:hypothetical protein
MIATSIRVPVPAMSGSDIPGGGVGEEGLGEGSASLGEVELADLGDELVSEGEPALHRGGGS